MSPADFRSLERTVEELKRQDGGVTDDRVAEVERDLRAFREELAQLRDEQNEVRLVAERALGEARNAGRVFTSATGPEPGRTGEIPLIPRAVVSSRAAVEQGGPPSTDGENREYEAAYRLFGKGEYSAAAESFQAFIQKYPYSDYADNAMFWMGECQHRLGDLVLAAVTFERVHEYFPEGNKVPDALYRQAVVLIAIGRERREPEDYQAAARDLLQRLVREYPRSERAAEAKDFLDRLGP
jgi:tol-pal system protein YbgF